jgi:hypothetical protein
MSQIDHAAILNAYLIRLTRADLEHILKQENLWTHAMLNQGLHAQIQCQAGFYAAVANATNNLLKHDITLIEKVLARETAQGVEA